jgi:hypothetical protein
MAKPSLIIMAAGIGSRFGGLKQIEPVGPGGELVIEYSIYDALRAGFGRIVFLIREEMADVFRERVGRRVENQAEVVYAFQRLDDLPAGFSLPVGRVKPWGTAHAVWSCRDQVDTPFAAINADDFYGRAAFEALGAYLSGLEAGGALEGCMAGYVLSNTLSAHGGVARGICQVSPQGNLLSVRERLNIRYVEGVLRHSEDGETWKTLSEDSTVSMNMWGLTPEVFGEIGKRFETFLNTCADPLKTEFYLPNLVGELIEAGRMRVSVLPVKARWFGVTYPADLPTVRERMSELVGRGEYPARLWS